MIRIAAVGDVHYDQSSRGRLAQYFSEAHNVADLLLLAGDLTKVGTLPEINALIDDLKLAKIPKVAVLGNHDFHSDQSDEVKEALQSAGIQVLEGSSTVIEIAGQKIGIVGQKGFGGGFVGACASDFGELEMKSFIRTTKQYAENLRDLLQELETEYKIVLLHYSPVEETLFGEKKEIYPFLGSYLLAEAIDEGGADIVFHGHAHHGVEKGVTPGGVQVRNVALPVIRHAYNIYRINKDGLVNEPSAHRRLFPNEEQNRSAAHE
jgi:Icc-related predicted phosphoesterase